jgi:hypothetical protein
MRFDGTLQGGRFDALPLQARVVYFSVGLGVESASTSFSNYFKHFSLVSTVPAYNLIASIALLRLKSWWT